MEPRRARTIRTTALVVQFAFAVTGVIVVVSGFRVPGLVLFCIALAMAVVPLVVPKPPPYQVRLTPDDVAAIREERASRGRFAAARSLRKQHPGMPFAQAMAMVQYA